MSFLVIGGAIATFGDCALAQVTPDGTLPNNSIVTPQGNTNLIEGGTQAGSNLFHSFEQFSIPTGGEAFFNNALDIQNIISRVTGESISNIDGLIRANGTANLFLLNPNGIAFGSNARLSIGGSFVGSTASSLNFADGTQFSATAPQTTPLLTVSVPIGLQYGGTTGSILNQSQATDSSGETVGLQVQPGKTLALVGGDVRFDGGNLRAPSARVELGGVAGAGTVGLFVDGNNLSLSFPIGVPLADVSLSGVLSQPGAYVTVFGGGGSIAINAQNLNLGERSGLVAGIDEGMGSIGSVAGDIQINATGTINLTNNALIANWVQPNATGNGGNINVTARSLFLTNGGVISTRTSGQGDAGSVTITASNAISFDGSFYNGGFISGVRTNVESGGVGNGGDINIAARSLSVTNGAQLFSATNRFGRGDAGNVTIQVSDTISFDGVGSNSPSTSFPSGAFANVYDTAEGNGGNINVTARSLSVTNGGQLSAGTSGQGDAGSVNINARDTVSFDGVNSNGYPSATFSTVNRESVGNGGGINVTTGALALTNGAQLNASTFGQGNAGSVNINVLNTVSFDGVDSNGLPSGAFSSVGEEAVGNGGNIDITARSLSVTDGAGLSASSGGNGAAGNIEVLASSIRLDNRATLSADSTAGQGNILLRSRDLVLRRGSGITANAQGIAIGANIIIDTDVLAALENSDISGNAENAFGGGVAINAQGIFGAQARKQSTPESDITSSSRISLSGVVQISTPDINLPSELVDASNQIATDCPASVRRGESKFIITGRGGLPPNPREPLNGDNVLTEWNTLDSDTENRPDVENRSSTAPSSTNPSKESAPTQIVEANGWMIGSNGEITLVANAPSATLDIPWVPKSGCNAPKPSS